MNEMHCNKCGGRVMVDRMYNSSKKKGEGKSAESNYLELSCIRCGKRWSLRKGTGAFALWLEKIEKSRESALGISS